jgi:hypothetical protein
MPTPEMLHATCYDSLGDKIFAFGGYQGGVSYQNYTYCYDPVTESWTTLAPIPDAIARIDAATSQWNRSIYICGGYNGSIFDSNHIYDLSANNWTLGNSMPFGRCSGGQVIYGDSLIYYLGGFDGTGPSDEVQIFNTYTNSWTTGTPLLKSWMMGGVAITGDSIWIIGGYFTSPDTNLYCGIIDPANCESISWFAFDNLPFSNSDNGATTMRKNAKSYLYMVGGDSIGNSWEYEISSGTWIPLPDYPSEIGRNDILVARDNADTLEIYVCGGDTSGSWSPSKMVRKLGWQPQEVSDTCSHRNRNHLNIEVKPIQSGEKIDITYTIKENGPISLAICDNSGRILKILYESKYETIGSKTVYWYPRSNSEYSIASGVYFCTLKSSNKFVTRKFILLR